MARKFFYVCAGMLMLALSYHLGANTAGAQSPALASPSEVAILQGVLDPGEVVPLPTYADGTPAVESDCRWMISLSSDNGGNAWCYTADAYYGATNATSAPHPSKGFLDSHRGRVVNSGQDDVPGSRTVVQYLIIATRGAGQPTQSRHETWGQVKSRYR